MRFRIVQWRFRQCFSCAFARRRFRLSVTRSRVIKGAFAVLSMRFRIVHRRFRVSRALSHVGAFAFL